jgi:hypothetical protein
MPAVSKGNSYNAPIKRRTLRIKGSLAAEDKLRG